MAMPQARFKEEIKIEYALILNISQKTYKAYKLLKLNFMPNLNDKIIMNA